MVPGKILFIPLRFYERERQRINKDEIPACFAINEIRVDMKTNLPKLRD